MSVAVPTAGEQTTGQYNERTYGGIYPVVVDAATTAASPTAAHASWTLFVYNAAGAVTFTIPESTSAIGKTYPIGTTFLVKSGGAGGVTIAKTGSDTLNGTATAAQHICRKVTKVSATVWETWV